MCVFVVLVACAKPLSASDFVPMDTLSPERQRTFIRLIQDIRINKTEDFANRFIQMEEAVDANTPLYSIVTDRDNGNTLAHHAALSVNYPVLKIITSEIVPLTNIPKNRREQTPLDILLVKLFDVIRVSGLHKVQFVLRFKM